MSLESIVIFISFTTLLVLLYWYQRKTKILLDDLNLFKKEKEYQHEAMMVFDKEFSIIYANQAARVLFSLDKSYRSIHHQDNHIIVQKDASSKADDFFDVLYKKLAQKENSFYLKNVLLGVSGAMRQANIYIDKSAWDKEGTMTCIIDMNNQDRSDTTMIQQDGAIDFFTGLPSQFAALSEINEVIKQHKNSAHSFAICLFGIDRFRELQSTLGLGFTNQLIRKTASYFETKKREGIRIYRMDADRFLMLIEGISDNEKIRQIAKDIIFDIQKIYQQNTPLHINISIGIVKFPENGENALKLINYAYMALGEAEKTYDENIVFFSIDYQSIEKNILRMSEEIRNALKNHEFILYYQPIFSLEDESLLGAEALIRWEHPQYGLIPAEKFLDIAKQVGQMAEIGEYVFQEAIKQRKKWHEKGLDIFQISLNISLEEMQVDSFIEKLEKLFKKYGADPKDFNLDISENAAIAHLEKSAIDFQLFKDLGISLSLDHFGSEVTSIKYLEQFPLSMIKIDRSLIFDLALSKEHQNIVKAIILLAHSLGIKVVAEGVETSKELALLQEYDCDYAQGYLFSRPIPAHEFEALIS